MYPAQESLQGCYQADMMAGVTRWNCIAYNWKRIPRLVQRALRECLSGEMGPVHMDIPVDIFFEHHFVPENRLRKILPPPGSSRFSGSFLPDSVAAAEAVQLMEKARKPVVVAGLSVLREGAWESLSAMAERIPAPVILAPGALSALAGENPSYIGLLGHPALHDLPEALGEADLLLMAGTVLREQEEVMDLIDRSRMRVIQTSPEPELLGSLGPVDAALCGDTASICGVLEKGMTGESGERARWLKACRQSFEASVESVRKDAKGKGPGAAISALGQVMRREDLMVLDGRESFYWGSLLCPAGRNNTRYLSHGLKGTGYGLPMALGVKLARPGERVFALCDTLSLFHHIQELDTARREGLGVMVSVVGKPFEWSKVAEGFGLRGVEVRGPAELMVALDQAGDSHTTMVIDMTRFEG
jgi:acetolactate synthase-1/2/3 large subunit